LDLVILITTTDGGIHTTDGTLLTAIGAIPIMDGDIQGIMDIITTQYTDGVTQVMDMDTDIVTDTPIEEQIILIILAEEALITIIT
jgi:hypothetical protein